MAQNQKVLPLGSIFRECLEVGIWWVKTATRDKLWYDGMQNTAALLPQGPDEKVSPGEGML